MPLRILLAVHFYFHLQANGNVSTKQHGLLHPYPYSMSVLRACWEEMDRQITWTLSEL